MHLGAGLLAHNLYEISAAECLTRRCPKRLAGWIYYTQCLHRFCDARNYEEHLWHCPKGIAKPLEGTALQDSEAPLGFAAASSLKPSCAYRACRTTCHAHITSCGNLYC